MSTTHAAMGVVLVVPLLGVAPEFGAVAGTAAYAGGVFPDLDVVYRHRRALHYPAYYWLAALPATGLAALAPGAVTVAAAAGLLSAAVHSAVDVFGGGVGLRPWANDDDRGVYLHPRGRWLRAREVVRYDGAPEDLLVVVALTVPAALAFEGRLRAVLLVGLVVSAVYTATRKRLPAMTPECLQ